MADIGNDLSRQPGKATAELITNPEYRGAKMSAVFSDEEKARIKTELCERIAEGEPLRAICREDGMPAWRTVYMWREDDKEFDTAIAHARNIGEEAILEDTLLIADTQERGQVITKKEWGEEIREEDMIAHRKLKIETRLKLLAKWNPKKYGDKVDHTSSDGSMSPKAPQEVDAQLVGALVDKLID